MQFHKSALCFGRWNTIDQFVRKELVNVFLFNLSWQKDYLLVLYAGHVFWNPTVYAICKMIVGQIPNFIMFTTYTTLSILRGLLHLTFIINLWWNYYYDKLYKVGYWSTEQLTNLPQITRHGECKAEVQVQRISLWNSALLRLLRHLCKDDTRSEPNSFSGTTGDGKSAVRTSMQVFITDYRASCNRWKIDTDS